jgi:MFS family permease
MTDEQELKRNVRALGVITLCYAAFQGICQSIVPLAMANQAFTKTTVGLIQAVPGIIVLLFGAPLARMANGKWRRGTLTAGFALTVIASLFYSRAVHPIDFVVPQLLFGLSSTAFWSNMVATSLRLSESPQRTRKIQGYVTAMQGIGAFGGPLLGGYLSIRSFTYGFYAGVLCAVMGLIASRFLSRSVAIEPRVGAGEFVSGAYIHLFRLITRKPIVVVGMCFVALNCFLLYVMGGSFYLLYANQIGLSAFAAAALISGRDAVSALLRLSFSAVSRRISPIVLLGVGTVLGALSLSLLPLSSTLFGAGLAAVAMGIFLGFLPPAVNTLMGSSTAPEEHSFAIAGMHSSNFIAQTTMSPLLGLLLSIFGYATVYPVAGGFWVVLALLVLRAGLRIKDATQSSTR